MIISVDVRKAFDKNPHPFMVTAFTKVVTERTYLNIITLYDKSTANIILNGEKLKAFPLRNKTRMPVSTLLLNTVLEVPATSSRQEK